MARVALRLSGLMEFSNKLRIWGRLGPPLRERRARSSYRKTSRIGFIVSKNRFAILREFKVFAATVFSANNAPARNKFMSRKRFKNPKPASERKLGESLQTSASRIIWATRICLFGATVIAAYLLWYSITKQ